MNAFQAKTEADSFNELNLEFHFSEIYRLIEKESKRGQYSVCIYKPIPNEVKDKLIKDGFKIDSVNSTELEIVISWSDI